jgi:hypothetical protein
MSVINDVSKTNNNKHIKATVAYFLKHKLREKLSNLQTKNVHLIENKIEFEFREELPKKITNST